MTELGEGSKWKVTWAEEDEFAEYVARGLAEILSRHNPYQNSDRHNLEYQFTCRLIRGRDVHPHYDREDDYFMSVRIVEKNWDYTKEHNPAHINMYGHDGLMGSNGPVGIGACFATKKPTIIFLGDAAAEDAAVVIISSSLLSVPLLIVDFFTVVVKPELTVFSRSLTVIDIFIFLSCLLF